jgi:phage terminase large subunit GpA-like protein
MSAVRQWLVGVLTAVYRPIERIALEFWAEKNIILRAKESIDRPGPYKRGRSIAAARILDAFMSDPQWRTLVVRKSSQTGLTLHVLILICRCIAEMQINILYIIDTIDSARDISQKRLQPMLEDCRATRQAISENSSDMNMLSYDLPSGALWLGGANSVGFLANKTAGLVAFDELDKPKIKKGEAHPWLLALNRMKMVEDGKAIGWSTPTLETGMTNVGYLAGSCHLLFVPCPRCGEFQSIEWENIRFDHCKDALGNYDLIKVLNDTWCQCIACKGRIDEHEKPDMVMAGIPRPTNFKEVEIDGVTQRIPAWAPGEMSAWISDLYSDHPKSTWGKIAVEFLQARGDTKKMHDWENGRMGRPIKHTVSNVTHRHVAKLRGSYKRGTLPVVPCVAVMAIDNQGNHQKFVKGAFMPNGDLYIVDWGRTLSLEEYVQAEKPDQIPIVDQPIQTPKGPITVQRSIVDEGGKDGTSYIVRNFCFRLFPKFVPCKGRGGVQVKNTIHWSESKLMRGGEGGIPVCHFDDDGFKTLLYIDRIKKFDEFKSRNFGVPRIWLPIDVTEEFVRELCGENLVKEADEFGVIQFVWQPNPPNDWGDGVKMLYVLWNTISQFFTTPEANLPPPDAGSAGAALVYLRSAGGSVSISRFDEDQAPIGPQLRALLIEEGAAAEHDGRISCAPTSEPA